VKINTQLLPWEKVAQLCICATSVIFTITTQSKQSPNRRKFDQSGHPARNTTKTSDIFFSEQPSKQWQQINRILTEDTTLSVIFSMLQINKKMTEVLRV
jgi:hypothetical protein